MKILRFNEADDFLNFNQFGPGSDVVETEDVTMTLDEFVNLDVFDETNLEKAILALKNHEAVELSHDNDSVNVSSKDEETAHVKYGDIEIDFDKKDLLAALQEQLDLAVTESYVPKDDIDKTKDDEMESVLKFKEFIEIEKNETKQDGKDSF